MISHINENKTNLLDSREFEVGDAIPNHYTLQLRELEEENTHLKNLVEQKTMQINELMTSNDKFISILGHELKGPFSAILGSLEILTVSLGKYTIDEIRKFVAIASDSAHKTLDLLDGILMRVMVRNKQKSIDQEKVNLNNLVGAELETMEFQGIDKKISVINALDRSLEVSANPHMVKIIMKILMSTAIKYTGFKGSINVMASERGKHIEITIKSGDILNETQEEIFKFDDLNTITDVHYEKGTRFGLLLCKEFVELHGGTIEMKSRFGEGCWITFTLPQYINV